jgi:iron complex outermembrane receptor protein
LSYKRGYKGPGFNVNTSGTTLVGGVNPFSGEKVEGVEGGVKLMLLNHTLALTANGYFYKYLGQQVSFVNNTTLVANIENGDNLDIKGGELGLTYLVRGIDGLTLNALVDMNRAAYTWFPAAPCYGNEPVSAGCINGSQNLAGATPFRAPRWTGQWGGEYRRSVTDKYQLAVNTTWNASSPYHTAAELNPTSLQPSYMTIDASIRFGKLDGPWELALIGRDLNNRYYSVDGVDVGAGMPGVISDTYQYIARPRQIMLQLTVRPNLF